MTGATICSGIGAPEVAWPWCDWKWCAEIEPFPSAVLKQRHPQSVNLGDINAPDFIERAKSFGPIDILIGGPPCQAFSVAGLRKGLADPRGNLTLRYLALVDALRPSWMVYENVPGILSATSHFAPSPHPPASCVGLECDGKEVVTEDEYGSLEDHAFSCLLAGLSEIGYGWAYGSLDAQFFNVAQRRERVFVIGCPGAWQPAAAVLLDRDSLCWNPAPSREKGQGVTGTLAARTSGGGGLGTDFDLGGGYSLSPPLMATGRGTDRIGETRGQDCVIPVLECGARTGKSTDDIRAAIGIGEDGDPMFTLQSGKQHGVFAFQERGRGNGERSLDVSEDVAYALTAPNGGGRRQKLNVCVPSTGDIAHCLNAGGMGRIDYETETMVTHSLTGEGFDASEDGTGCSTPLVPICASSTGDGYWREDETSGTIRGRAQESHEHLMVFQGKAGSTQSMNPHSETSPALDVSKSDGMCVAFSCKDSGGDASEISPTLRAMEFDGSHANGGGQVAVAVALRGREGGATAEIGDECNGALRAGGGGGDKAHVLANMAVRRLTPRECERLQSFEDDFTAVIFRGKKAADGPRYKSIGNSMCVNVIRYLGDRIRQVHET